MYLVFGIGVDGCWRSRSGGTADFDFRVAEEVEFRSDGSRFHSAVDPVADFDIAASDDACADGIGAPLGRRFQFHLHSGETVRFTVPQFRLNREKWNINQEKLLFIIKISRIVVINHQKIKKNTINHQKNKKNYN